jgi:hypothetical protein
MPLKSTIAGLLLFLLCCDVLGQDDLVQSFVDQHWPAAIEPQGKMDDSLTEIEKSLAPVDCGACHVQQYKDWQTALHSKSMGPGIVGQLVEMVDDDPNSADMCWSCHSPLAEQKRKIFKPEAGWIDNPVFDPGLQKHGMMCAACHVRQNRVYGPPRKTSPQVTGQIDENLPHRSFNADNAFTQSEFCKGCHQFNEDDFSLNGKLIENTFNEWQESKYAAEGIQCQDCHMPDRRHLWRGIHDADMVKSGVEISVNLSPGEYARGDWVNAVISVNNSGVGHYFPTYLTPKVFVIGRLLDSEGNELTESRQEYVIGRESYDLAVEAYDTRIPPGEQIQIAYQYELPADELQLRIEVIVDPDHWYRRFYQNYLEDGGGGRGRALLLEALRQSSESSFSIFDQTLVLNDRSIEHPVANRQESLKR